MTEATYVVTGGNAGLGYRCAQHIARQDAANHVVLACRNTTRGSRAAQELRDGTGNPNISARPLDLAELDSVRTFADEFSRASLPPLRGMVGNAGISAGGVPGTARTADGFEPIFQVNHLGHFLLASLLIDRMPSGRIVFVTSDLHDPPAFFPARVTYRNAARIAEGRAGMPQYCVSKLCNLYCAYEMDRRFSGRIAVNAFNPGAMADTGFSRPSGNVLARKVVRAVGGVMGALIGKRSTAERSGAVLASIVTGTAFDGISGQYIDRDHVARSSTLSYDRDNARELWESSRAMCGLTDFTDLTG